MIPYLTLICSVIAFLFVLALPWSNQVEGNHYQHTEVRIQQNQKVFRSDGITRIENNHVVHLASLKDSSMQDPVVIRFSGKARSFDQFGFSLSGTLDLMSVQSLRPVIDDTSIYPYLLLNNDPYSVDIKILYTAEDYILIREEPSGRVKLLAKRELSQ
ncbi:hypothetical protein [Vibrio tetraodonis]|uniref:hypothetical protein n=1 Tax=Vibrio tetraodonis TaxID=2231647 RepID=UPI000E0BAC44|nr:hypothetical protein [Vibrio tetraodonis]